MSPMRWAPWVVLASLVVATAAWAAGGETGAARDFDALVRTASLVAPLGLSPLFALAGFGIAAGADAWVPPPSLEFLAHPATWLALLAFAFLIQFGRSTKLTKPLAEIVGTGESLLALVAVGLTVLPMFAARPAVEEAGIAGGLFVLAVGLSTTVVVIVVRTALDVLIWLSPIPLVDAAFQVLKLLLTAALVALAVFAPIAAMVLNLIIVIAALYFARWALRTANFGLVAVSDVTLGRMKPRLPLPQDPVIDADLGPFVAFVDAVEGLPKRREVSVRYDAGRWYLDAEPGAKALFLGDGARAVIRPGWLCSTLELPSGSVLLPGRYRHLLVEIGALTEGRVEAASGLYGRLATA